MVFACPGFGRNSMYGKFVSAIRKCIAFLERVLRRRRAEQPDASGRIGLPSRNGGFA